MAIDFITISLASPEATQAAELKNWIAIMRQVYEMGERIKDKMVHMQDGANFAELEKRYGIPAAQGQTVFDLVNGSIGAMEGTFQNSNCVTITERVG